MAGTSAMTSSVRLDAREARSGDKWVVGAMVDENAQGLLGLRNRPPESATQDLKTVDHAMNETLFRLPLQVLTTRQHTVNRCHHRPGGAAKQSSSNVLPMVNCPRRLRHETFSQRLPHSPVPSTLCIERGRGKVYPPKPSHAQLIAPCPHAGSDVHEQGAPSSEIDCRVPFRITYTQPESPCDPTGP